MNKLQIEPRAGECAPLDVLDEFERRGLSLCVEGNLIKCDAQRLPVALRHGLTEHGAAIRAVLSLRQVAAERQRFGCFISPNREFWARYRAACDATGARLRFDGQGISQRPEKRPPTPEIITCSNVAPQDSLF